VTKFKVQARFWARPRLAGKAGRLNRLLSLGLLVAASSIANAADWVRPGWSTNQPVWGLRGGLLWAVAPGGFRGGEPRGLIRLGYPVLAGQRYDLVNFIAVEPIVQGRRGFSELERSRLDGLNGKRIWAEGTGESTMTNAAAGYLRKSAGGGEELEVKLRVEKFDNGAHVRLVVHQRSDRPDEIALSLFQEPDSAPLDYCILTATMGNMARTRLLWLKDEVVSSLELYQDYKAKDFAPHRQYPLSHLHRTAEGRVLAGVTNDEPDPAATFPFPGSELWHYAGFKVTQYWAREADTFGDDLHVVVNGRYTYWRSTRPIPGGIAFENFEMQERFRDGQTFIFGITRRTPQELGFPR
jgi:hypothetical protein